MSTKTVTIVQLFSGGQGLVLTTMNPGLLGQICLPCGLVLGLLAHLSPQNLAEELRHGGIPSGRFDSSPARGLFVQRYRDVPESPSHNTNFVLHEYCVNTQLR